MPSTKKRINLTVPDNIYEMIQDYKQENGLESDATACLQLIVRQLKSLQDGKTILNFITNTPIDVLVSGAQDGFEVIQAEFAKQQNPNGKSK